MEGKNEKKKEKKKAKTPALLFIVERRLVTNVARDACNVICRGSLFPDSEQSPAVYLRDDPLFGSLQLQQHSELRAPTAERAAFYLDAAVAGRQREDGDAHMLYTLHVYQYSVAGKGGGELSFPRKQRLSSSCLQTTSPLLSSPRMASLSIVLSFPRPSGTRDSLSMEYRREDRIDENVFQLPEGGAGST